MTQPTSPRLANIVVGVDDSAESLYALALAATIGTPQRATLAVVHVRPHPKAFGFGPAGVIEYAKAEDEVDKMVTADATARLGDYPGTWTVTIRSGNVGRELLAVADHVDADLIVLGHRSHGTVHDAILGSTAATTVHHS
ncbi:MAG: universal stress protein, partial [Acidimicrobiales bacterium]|nr:universal stress protein [Acidimicrobiales bacterium]